MTKPPSLVTRLRCLLFGHAPKQYCETVMHYEVLCRRCGRTVTRIPPLASGTGEG